MQITEFLNQYLTEFTPFRQFDISHLGAVLLMLALCTLLPYFAKKILTIWQQHLLGTAMGVFVLANFIFWYLVIISSGTFNLQKDLPLQACHFANIFLFMVMWRKNENWFRIFYFWVLAGTMQAIITPDIQADYPHYWFWRYWIVHAGPVVCIVYAAYVYGFRPRASSILKSFLAINLVLLIIGILNYFLNTNYAFLISKPAVKSLFDYLGPWPWYVLVADLAAFILFTVVYIPYWLMDLRNKKSKVNFDKSVSF